MHIQKYSSKSINKQKNKFLLTIGFTMLFFSILIGSNIIIEGAREIYEEMTTANAIVDLSFGQYSLYLENKETRTVDKLLLDVENTIYEAEGMQKVFDNYRNMTAKEKTDFINYLIQIINDSANTNIEGFILKNGITSNMKGYFQYGKIGNFVFASNYIYLAKDSLQRENFLEVIYTVIHEMLHAVNYTNVVLLNSVDELDKEMLYISSGGDSVYISSFAETNIHLRVELIKQKLIQKYTFDTASNNRLKSIMQEIIMHVYDPRQSVARGISPEELTDLKVKYQNMTIEELFYAGFKKKLKKELSREILESTYYAKDFINLVEKIYGNSLNAKYIYFKMYDGIYSNVESAIEQFEINYQNEFNYNEAFNYAKIINSLRYNLNNYSTSEVEAIQKFAARNIKNVPEPYIALCGLEDVLEAVRLNDFSKIQIIK